MPSPVRTAASAPAERGKLAAVLRSAARRGAFGSNPVGTLRQELTDAGWPFKPTRTGARVQVTPGLGETWTADIIVVPARASRIAMSVRGVPPTLEQSVQEDRASIGLYVRALAMKVQLGREFGVDPLTRSGALAWVGTALDAPNDGSGRFVVDRDEVVVVKVGGSPWGMDVAVQVGGQCATTRINPQRPFPSRYPARAGQAVAGARCAPTSAD